MKERVLTAVVLLAIVVGALFFDPTGWAVKVLVVLIAFACGIELGKLTQSPFTNIVPGVLVGYMVFIWGSQPEPIFPLFYAVLAVPFLILSVRHSWKYLGAAVGTVWVCAALNCFFQLAANKSPSNWPLLMTAAIPIWCGDTAAIFVGKAFGKHKLAPSISPNKTWEGSIGNLLACVGAALILGAIFHYPMLLMVLLGLNCGILGQAGDLFESWLKRKADVKDSGNILPGHGGLLDRLDSLMATTPISLLILQSLVVPGTHS